MKETTRLGTSADLDLLEDFVALGVAEQAENKGGSIWSRRETPSPPFRASIEAVLHDPDQEVIIGLIDEAPVGMYWQKLPRVKNLLQKCDIP